MTRSPSSRPTTRDRGQIREAIAATCAAAPATSRSSTPSARGREVARGRAEGRTGRRRAVAARNGRRDVGVIGKRTLSSTREKVTGSGLHGRHQAAGDADGEDPALAPSVRAHRGDRHAPRRGPDGRARRHPRPRVDVALRRAPVSKDETAWPWKGPVRGRRRRGRRRDDEETALEAMRLIDVRYEPFHPISTSRTGSRSPRSPSTTRRRGTNVHKSSSRTSGTWTPRSRIAPRRLARFKFAVTTRSPSPMRHRALRSRRAPHIWSATQVPHYVHRALAEVLEIDMHRIRVIGRWSGCVRRQERPLSARDDRRPPFAPDEAPREDPLRSRGGLPDESRAASDEDEHEIGATADGMLTALDLKASSTAGRGGRSAS